MDDVFSDLVQCDVVSDGIEYTHFIPEKELDFHELDEDCKCDVVIEEDTTVGAGIIVYHRPILTFKN